VKVLFFALPYHGAHSGEVAMGSFGPPGRQVITMIGDTANVAARLCDRPRAGEVLFSGAIAAALSTDDGSDMGARPFLNFHNLNCADVANYWISGAYQRPRDSRTE
jgi:class 3 adenylate cyclase